MASVQKSTRIRRKPAAKKSVAKKKAVAKKRAAPAKVKLAPNEPVAKRVPAKKKAAAKKPRAFTPAFAKQRTGAHPKDLLLFELERARVAVHAAMQGVAGGLAERRARAGGWTIREVVLHLIARDKVRLEEFERALSGTPVSWTGIEHAQMAAVNEWHLGELRHLGWDDAVRLLHAKREELMRALAAVPAEPAERWTSAHPFGAMLQRLPEHDRHHAEQIRQARSAG